MPNSRQHRKDIISKIAQETANNNLDDINDIRSRFNDKLEGTQYGVNGISIGSVVFYVPLNDQDRISMGILVNIEKGDTENIRRLILKNPNYGNVWKIVPQRVFLFWRRPLKKGEKWNQFVRKLAKDISESGHIKVKKVKD